MERWAGEEKGLVAVLQDGGGARMLVYSPETFIPQPMGIATVLQLWAVW